MCSTVGAVLTSDEPGLLRSINYSGPGERVWMRIVDGDVNGGSSGESSEEKEGECTYQEASKDKKLRHVGKRAGVRNTTQDLLRTGRECGRVMNVRLCIERSEEGRRNAPRGVSKERDD